MKPRWGGRWRAGGSSSGLLWGSEQQTEQALTVDPSSYEVDEVDRYSRLAGVLRTELAVSQGEIMDGYHIVL